MTPTAHRIRTMTAAVAIAAAAALAGPSVVSADTTSAFNAVTRTATITGDGDSDKLVISDQGGLLKQALNDGAAQNILDDLGQPLPADRSVNLVVNAGAGDDQVQIATNLLQSATVDGGAGLDAITGSDNDDVLRGGTENDTIAGGDGDDRLIGDPGADDLNGGNGNDTLVWNNGDGSDTMDGEGGGGDEVEVNGAAGPRDVFTVKPNGTRVRFDRVNLVPFNLDIDAERITVNGLQGDDQVTGDAGLAPLIAMTLNGGQGADTLTGGDGNDLITGGDDGDTLTGGAGNDRIVGDRGGDTVAGGDGDDTLVWNNGDGSDTMDGENGLDRIEVNGAAGQGDAFTIAPNAARARFQRTNLVPFTLDIGSAEALDARGAGGDDTFAAQPGTGALMAVTADGGTGNDALTGAEEADTFFGGAGNDTLDGGPGPDLLDGQDGDDTLRSRDGQSDLVRGGAGTDSGVLDALGTDVWDSIENVDAPVVVAPPAPDTKGTAVRVGTSTAGVRIRRNGRASTKLAVSCPAAEAGGCNGTLQLFSAKAIRIGSHKVIVRLGGASYNLRSGEAKTLTVNLPKGVRKLAKKRSIAARAETLTRDAAGNTAAGSKALTLRLPR
jgi:Ca2+-binding RTX toxin-like protein